MIQSVPIKDEYENQFARFRKVGNKVVEEYTQSMAVMRQWEAEGVGCTVAPLNWEKWGKELYGIRD